MVAKYVCDQILEKHLKPYLNNLYYQLYPTNTLPEIAN